MNLIQKHQFKQVAAFAGLYFLAIGLGVLLGSLVDHRGNMFYAPAFSALVGGGIYRVYVEKNSTDRSYSSSCSCDWCFFPFHSSWGRSLFFLLLLAGVLAELVAARGHYQSKLGNALSFLLFFLCDDRAHSYDVVPTSQLPCFVTGSW